MIRDTVRRFVLDEIKPNLEQLEHGDLLPYEILRKMLRTFGLDAMARESFRRQVEGERADAFGGMLSTARPEGEASAAGRSAAKETFSMERSGVTAMALGMVQQCLELSLQIYAGTDEIQVSQIARSLLGAP